MSDLITSLLSHADSGTEALTGGRAVRPPGPRRGCGGGVGLAEMERTPMNILSFDVESNGLHGQAFAVGAVIRHVETAQEVDRIGLRCPIEGDVNAWVAENVLPALAEMPETHTSAREMRAAFWTWYQTAKGKYADLVMVADIGYPVETGFLTACQADDPARAWEGPYPLHEVATLLLAADIDPDIDRLKFAGYDADELHAHNPIDDALVSAKCAEICFARLT